MTKFASSSRKALAAVLAVAAIAAVAAPGAASAHGFKSGGHGHGHGGGFGFGAAGFAGGLLIGALAASDDDVVYERRCWVERQRGFDDDGFPFVRRIRVCD